MATNMQDGGRTRKRTPTVSSVDDRVQSFSQARGFRTQTVISQRVIAIHNLIIRRSLYGMLFHTHLWEKLGV